MLGWIFAATFIFLWGAWGYAAVMVSNYRTSDVKKALVMSFLFGGPILLTTQATMVIIEWYRDRNGK